MGFLDGILEWFSSGAGIGALESLIAFLWDAILYLWAAVLWAFNQLLAALTFLFGKIGGAFKWIWEHVIKGGLTKLANLIIKAHLWLETHLAPVLKFLLKVRKYIDRIFKLYIRPILKVIQQVRQVLLILRLLHIKWAQQLDTYLAKIQADISRVFLTIRGTLNALIDVVGALTGTASLRRMVAGAVVTRRAIAGISRMATGLQIGFFCPSTTLDSHPWELPVTRASDITDPVRNPTASQLFGIFDPLGISDFIAADPIPTDAMIDGTEPLPYGAQVLSRFWAAEAGIDGMDVEGGTLADALESHLGLYYDSGQDIQAVVTTPGL